MLNRKNLHMRITRAKGSDYAREVTAKTFVLLTAVNMTFCLPQPL